jgi:hypothetical protein
LHSFDRSREETLFIIGRFLRFKFKIQIKDTKDTVFHRARSLHCCSAAFAIRSTYHTTLKATPGQLVFGRDMLLPIKFKANWAEIKARHQEEMRHNNERENKGRKIHDYKVGDRILLTDSRKKSKLSPPREGPYQVEHVYTNGTLLIQRGAVSERVNI